MAGLASKVAITSTAAGVSTPAVPNFQHYNYLSFQVLAGVAAGGAAQVVVTPEVSNDGVTWAAIAGDALTVLATANGMKAAGSYPYAYLRFLCTADAGTLPVVIHWCAKE